MMIAGGVLVLFVTIIIIVVVVNNNKEDGKPKGEAKAKIVKSKEGVFKTAKASALSNREPDYYYTDGEYEIRGHKGHEIIDNKKYIYDIKAEARKPTFNMDDRERILLEKFKSTNVKFIDIPDTLASVKYRYLATSETSKGISPGNVKWIGYIINKVKYE